MSNQQQQQDLDTVTHPSLYRDSSSNTEDWDLYPQMIRKVENEGNQKQVEHLHELENTSSH
ncbi:hypothetical protein BD560DRAFT_438806 [Blakeslea trispora]|nr:hypothetical protein BD560DRAFT_438806 [Blakeslea trispora]